MRPDDRGPNSSEPQGSKPDPLPPLVAWASRNSGWLILLTILAVVLLEGVVLFSRR